MSEASSDSAPAVPTRLYGARAHQLMQDIALDDRTQTELAELYGVTQPAVSMFAKRHAVEIRAMREDPNDPFAGILFAKKQARVAELQADIAAIEEELSALEGKDRAAARRVKASALKQIAEELGQLTTHVEAKTSVVLEGIDLDELR